MRERMRCWVSLSGASASYSLGTKAKEACDLPLDAFSAFVSDGAMRVNGLMGAAVKGSGETASWSSLAGSVVVSIDSIVDTSIVLAG